MSVGTLHNDPWRVTCPKGHVRLTTRNWTGKGGQWMDKSTDEKRWWCRTCNEHYRHAIDQKHDTKVKP